MSVVDDFEHGLIAHAQGLDQAGGEDIALKLADWTIDQLRNGPCRLDPDGQLDPLVEYEIRVRLPNGKRLATHIKSAELNELDADGRLRHVTTKAAALVLLFEQQKGQSPTDIDELAGHGPEQTIEEYAAGFDPDRFEREHPRIAPEATP